MNNIMNLVVKKKKNPAIENGVNQVYIKVIRRIKIFKEKRE